MMLVWKLLIFFVASIIYYAAMKLGFWILWFYILFQLLFGGW